MRIRIPLLMFGPYLRPFLEFSILISGALFVILFSACCMARLSTNREALEKASAAIFSFFIIFIVIFALFWLLGMP